MAAFALPAAGTLIMIQGGLALLGVALLGHYLIKRFKK